MKRTIATLVGLLALATACVKSPLPEGEATSRPKESRSSQTPLDSHKTSELTITEDKQSGASNSEDDYGSQAGTLKPKRCDPKKDCVVAFIAEDMDWGCPTLTRGANCKMPFMGYYAFITMEQGTIVFQAFENDSPVAIVSQQISVPPLPRRGSFNPSATKLIYQVGPTANKVTFQAVLKNSAGVVVAEGFENTYKVGS